MAVSYKDINELDQKQVPSGSEKVPVSDVEYLTIEQIAKYANDPGHKPFLSLKRVVPYLFDITFDTLSEDNGGDNPVPGNCSSFVQNGKLYRNLDFFYDESAEFRVHTKDFDGMSFITGLDDGALDLDLIAQLPYRVNDGINRHNIKVSTHVLYNDWEWTGAGQRTIPLTRLPFYVLSRVKSMATITEDLGDILDNVYAPEGLAAMEYLLQIFITDGTTSYALLPPFEEGQSYILQDITSNPKMANFRWVSSETVIRTSLQDRPTGVERFNLMPCPLSELRFTKAYESPTRLSEFIGIDGTTKDSTDAELEDIYNRARALYLERERDGQTWQTVHSVVYSDRMESLFVQENFEDDYAEVTKDDIPTKTSDLANDSGFQTETQVDEAVAAEAARASAAERAIANAIPTSISQLNEDSGHRTVTDVEKARWDNKVDKITGKGLSTNDYTNEDKAKVSGAIQGVKKNGTDITPDSDKKVDISVPTALSEMSEDTGHRTVTDAEKATWSAKADTSDITEALSPIADRTSALESQINKVVLDGMTQSEDGSTVKLTLAKINIKTGATTTQEVSLPVADASGAGVMNPQTYQTIQSNQTLINALLGASVAVSGLASEPTQAQVTAAWRTATGLTDLVNGARVFDVTNQKVWTYFTNDTTWHPVSADGGGSVVVSQWTNSALGTVKGVADNTGHTNDGKITAETDGTGSVLGWDRLTGRVQTIEGKESGWDAKYDKPSSGIPASDLASSVQTSLGKADSAYQKPSSGIPASDIASGVIPTVPTTLSQLSDDTTHRLVTDTEKTTWNNKGTYNKPSSGIPESDLSTSVQTSLGKADSAVQEAPTDGKQYARQDGEWEEVATSGGGTPLYNSIPSDNKLLSDAVYIVGELTGSVTIDFATPATGKAGIYFIRFSTGATAPTITWGTALTGWAGGSTPTFAASKTYEVMMMAGIGKYEEV